MRWPILLRIGPLSRTARPLAHTNTKISSISIINYSTKMGDLLALQNALADLNLQEHPNISETARRHGVERSKLSKHWRGVQVSMEEYHESQNYMTDEQAQSLINYINLLTDRGTPSTPPMVKRFVKDITGIDVGKNYVNKFWRKFDDQLLGGYIAPVDLKHKKADNALETQIYAPSSGEGKKTGTIPASLSISTEID